MAEKHQRMLPSTSSKVAPIAKEKLADNVSFRAKMQCWIKEASVTPL